MYESFFQFHRRPFPSTPQVELYFPANSTENAFHTLARLIERAEGPGLLIGGPGTGKTLVCQMLKSRFGEAFHVVVLNSAQLTTQRALLQHILFHLELPYRGLDEGELLLALMEFLQPEATPKEGLLLLVDEAHTLPPAVLEGLRTITNVTRDGQPRVHLVLAGGPLLEDRFAHPELSCFNQRLAARCYLQPLNYDETCAYVHWQIGKAGAPPDRVMAPDAWQPVYHATDGIPRLINQVCDHALVLACTADRNQLDGRMIEEAWADLQQLPTPWQPASNRASEAAHVVEFGGLDADDEDFRAPLEQGGAVESQDEAPSPEASPPTNQPTLPADQPTSPIEQPTLPVDQPTQPTPVAPACSELSNPFDERFEQEQVVIDRYAALQAAESGTSPTMMQQREITAAMQTIFQSSVHFVEPPEAPQPAEPAAEIEDQVFEAVAELGREVSETAEIADDCPRPEEPAIASVDDRCMLLELADQEELEEPEQEDSPTIQVLRTLPPDDNDMIVVVDDQQGETPLRSSGGISHRLEYRQLFSRLRRSRAAESESTG
jgi:type II secretory pathway predicted ATPase ExeA